MLHELDYLIVPLATEHMVYPVHTWKFVCRYIITVTGQVLHEILFIRKVNQRLSVDQLFALVPAILRVTDSRKVFPIGMNEFETCDDLIEAEAVLACRFINPLNKAIENPIEYIWSKHSRSAQYETLEDREKLSVS